MNATLVKNLNGLLMIAIHFGAIFYVFQGVSARLQPADQLAVVMILSPLTAAFVSLFLKDLVKFAVAATPPAPAYRSSFAIVTIVITVLYGSTLGFILFNYLANTDVTADMLKLYIGVIETVIGGFVGIVYGELYKA